MVAGDNFWLWCHVPMGTVSQLDGASPHIFHHIHVFLDREFPDHWVGRGGPIPWPPHSPDLTLLDFFFLNVCKGHCLS